ncbi:hypothetical protein G9A89_007132 [Geosiphon pyriformis]|nr:hypothetical protein G9A89_007132 [Geosiphon pyriformis]
MALQIQDSVSYRNRRRGERRSDQDNRRTGRVGNNRIGFSACERWVPNCITRAFVGLSGDTNIDPEEWDVYALTRQPGWEQIEELRRAGVCVQFTDYSDIDCLMDSLRDLDYLIWFAEGGNRRVEESKMMAEACRRMNVCVIMVSVQGADDGEGKTFDAYRQMERAFENELAEEDLQILRCAFIQQAFWLFSHYIRVNCKLNMMIDECNDFFPPINFNDMANAIESLMMCPIDQKIFTLTGPDAENARDCVGLINNSITGEIGYARMTREEMEEYLSHLPPYAYNREENTYRRGGDRRDRDGSQIHNYGYDQCDYPRPFLPLYWAEVELWQYMKSGKANSPTLQVHDITQTPPQDLYQFFMRSSDDFEPSTRRNGKEGRRQDDRFNRGHRGDLRRHRNWEDDEYNRGRRGNSRRHRDWEDDEYNRGRRGDSRRHRNWEDDEYNRGHRGNYNRGRRSRDGNRFIAKL